MLTKEDIITSIKYLLNLTKNKGEFDDIDHLGNRRLRTVGELISLYGIRVGMVRVEREIKERMSLISGEELNVLPSQVVNSKPLIVAINSFYRTSQLSTIVDQTNPLSELDNLRRITVGGPGGIEKKELPFQSVIFLPLNTEEFVQSEVQKDQILALSPIWLFMLK